MSTVGQQLLQPESGWDRIDDTDSRFSYSGTWSNVNNTGAIGGVYKYCTTIGNKISFTFVGTGIRVLSAYGNNQSKQVSISIDGEEEIYNPYGTANAVLQSLVYEKTNLTNESHVVVITSKENTTVTSFDGIDIFIPPLISRLALKNLTTNQHYSLADKTLILLPDGSDETMINYGIVAGKEIKLDEAFDKIKTVNSDGTFTDTNVPPFSVYDHISENPQVIVYTESTDDITVSTTTEPYDLYGEFGDEIEVLYYTDDKAVTEADLILEANYSPIDELEGDFEVVTWTDESPDTAKRILEVTGTHKPIFTYPINPLEIEGSLSNLLIEEASNSKDAKYLISNNNSTWYKWDVDKFVVADETQVSTVGMTLSDLMNINYSKWTYNKINVGVYLTKDSLVKKIELNELVPTKSSKVSDLHFYILNTTAKIDIELRGNTIMGQVTDDDSSKVQYRVTLNGGYYYPTTGNYTALSDSPSNINLTLRSQDIKISEWNDLKVEFKDSFGTVDSWEIQFIGQYDGLLFKTTDGNFYSSDIGEVLQYLDFGLIIAGQTTMEYEVVLKNQYGYGVKDVGLSVVESNLPSGVKVEFSNDGVENWQNRLPVATTMNSDDEVTFRVRMRTELTSEPRSNGSFDIYVNALKDE